MVARGSLKTTTKVPVKERNFNSIWNLPILWNSTTVLQLLFSVLMFDDDATSFYDATE